MTPARTVAYLGNFSVPWSTENHVALSLEALAADEDGLPWEPAAPDPIGPRLTVLEVRAALLRLPLRDRIMLRHLAEGATQAEIGRAVGLSPQRVSQLLPQAKARLLAALWTEEPLP